MESEHFSSFRRSVENNNKRARKAGAIYNLTEEEFEAAYIYFGGKCAYSGQPFSSPENVSIEHIIPIISGGHSMAFNCIPVGSKYNSSKSGYHLLDWWKCQSNSYGNTIYNPLRLLKVLNYMVKCLESISLEEPIVHILKDNEIDTYLLENQAELDSNREKGNKRNEYKKISQLEVLRKMDMVRIEDLYSIYSELDSIKLNTAIFFEETIHELEGDIPQEILDIISNKIKAIPDIYLEGKKVFKKEMKPEDVKIRSQVLEWSEKEELENKYGIIGYMDFEVLKEQEDVMSFLDVRKNTILSQLGANSKDFDNVVNKVPNILTNLDAEERLADIEQKFSISREMKNGNNSELYSYIINKPDLLLSGENMDILIKYAEKLHIDKRLLRRGVPVTTLIDNIEMAIELLEKAELDADENTKKRILDRLVNGTTGNHLRDAYRTFRKMVLNENEEMTQEEEKRDASRWIICISEKFSASDVLKPRRINDTKHLYSNMKFNSEGFLEGVNPNVYILPQILKLAKLNISLEAEEELIDNMFFIDQIRHGKRADIVLRELGSSVKKDNPNMSDEEVMTHAARWFVFLSEASQVHLSVMFDDKVKDKYIEITKDYYKSMKFDDKSNFIDIPMPELNQLVIGVDYMRLADMFFNSKGDFYVIKGGLVPKSEIQTKLYEKLSKCKNKKEVKTTCRKMLNELSGDKPRRGGKDLGK